MLSIFLARLLGFQLLIVGIAMFMQPERFRAAVKDFHSSQALVLIGAGLPLLFGLAIAIAHNVWSGWPILITLLGYLMIAKGLSRLFMADQGRKLSEELLGPSYHKPASIAVVALGVILLVLGFL